MRLPIRPEASARFRGQLGERLALFGDDKKMTPRPLAVPGQYHSQHIRRRFRGIPVASVGLVLGIHRLMSQGLTPTNFLGNAVATIVMAKWEGALDEKRLHRVLDARPAEEPAEIQLQPR